MIRLLVYFLISGGFIAGFHLWQYGTEITAQTASNALFYIGIFMFFGGVISLTNASKVFHGITYVYKSLSRNFKAQYETYYDYHQAKNQDGKGVYGLRVLILGIIYLVVSIILALPLL